MDDSLWERFLEVLSWKPFASLVAWEVTLGQLLLATGMVVGAMVAMRLIVRVVRAVLARRGHEGALRHRGALAAVDLIAFFVGLRAATAYLGIDLSRILDTTLFTLPGATVTVLTLFVALGIVLVAFLISRVIQAAMERSVRDGTSQARANVYTLARLVHYLVMIVGLLVALQTIGIDLAAVLAVGGVFMLAIGFAMKNIAENFVSGLILMIERAVKVGDIIAVDGIVARVGQLGIRTTIVHTRDGEELIVPNALIVQSTVKNYTYRDSLYRIRIEVGVTYDSDMQRTHEILTTCANGVEWRSTEREPTVFLKRFGSSSVDFEVSVWLLDPWVENLARSNLHRAVWNALREAGIVIAFPQLDLHLDPPVVEAVRKAGGLDAA